MEIIGTLQKNRVLVGSGRLTGFGVRGSAGLPKRIEPRQVKKRAEELLSPEAASFGLKV